MKLRRRLAVVAATAAVLGAGAGAALTGGGAPPAATAAVHHASIAPALTGPKASSAGPVRFSWHTDHCYRIPVRQTAIGKETQNTANATYISSGQDAGNIDAKTGTFTVFCPVNVGTTGWQELVDSVQTGLCASWDNTRGFLSEHTCNGLNYELFWMTLFSQPYYILANQWTDQNEANWHCPSSAPAPVWTAPDVNYGIEIACRPDGTHAYYSQLWQAVAVT